MATQNPNTGAFIYEQEVVLGKQRCKPEVMRGFFDKAQITPDGRVAVVPVGLDFYAPRELVVLRFKDGECEPISIQHIPFKETQA